MSESVSVSALLNEVRFRLRSPWDSTLQWLRDRVTDRATDAKFGIQTSQRISLSSLGLDAPDCSPYQPLSYNDLHHLFRSLSITESDVFLDVGSGMGRAVCVAASYPFQAVVGVELSSELCTIARQNVDRVKPRAHARDIRIVNADATAFTIPREVTLIYFFNPFRKDVLARVLGNIAVSLQSVPRNLTIVFCGTASVADFEKQASACEWLAQQSVDQLPSGMMSLRYRNSQWTAPERTARAGAI